MKKSIYLILALLTATPSMATQKVTNSLIVASTLLVSNKKYDKNLSLDLHYAVEKRDYTSVQKLITNPKVDINAKVDYTKDVNKLLNIEGTTPLITCCRMGDESLQIAKALLEHDNINVNVQDKHGNTPLIQCCLKGDESLQIAKALLERKDINVNLEDKESKTPLIACSCNGDEALMIAKLLLKHKDIKVNLADIWGSTPLTCCCIIGDKSLAIAKALLAHKDINVNLKDKEGNTPLVQCCCQGDTSLQIAKALLERKDINVNLEDKENNTPLDIIISQLKKNCTYYTYVRLWNVLVAKGAILGKCTTDYNHLHPTDFKEPQKGYIQSIKRNPPKSVPSLKNNLLGK